MTSFDGKPIAQVARWEVACLQTILVQLGLSAVTLRQISEGLQKFARQIANWLGSVHVNFCLMRISVYANSNRSATDGNR